MSSMIAKTKTGIGKKATKISSENGHFTVQLYATVVYDETAETVTLANGGWATPTTRQRINSALAHRGFMPTCYIKYGEMFYRGKKFVDGKLVIPVAEMKPF